MKIKPIIHVALLCLLTISGQLSTSLAQGTAFTYQGRLADGANPASGTYDLQFRIYDASSAGSAVTGFITNSAVSVSNGLFTAALDFGTSPFTGSERWLEIGVRTNGNGAFTTLGPRQPLTATPYALYAPNAGAAITAASAATVSPGGVATAGLQANAVTTDKIADGTIQALDVNAMSFNTTFWSAGGNAGTTPGTHFLGTTDNQPLELRINNQPVIRVMPTTSVPNFVGGLNAIKPPQITSGVRGAVIAGGGAPSGAVHGYGGGDFHGVSDSNGTIGGGFGNRAGNFDANVDNAAFATVAGGIFNYATNYAAAVGGGDANLAGGSRAVVAGGYGNSAIGNFAMVPGGYGNIAEGNYSLAAGHMAKANHAGAFVWADSTGPVFESSAANQFLIRAAGNVGIGTTNPQVALDVNGMIRSRTNGFQFPDGTTQTTAAGVLADGSVTTPKIANSAVTSVKLADSAVTATKIASAQVVKSLNSMKDDVTIIGGDNITVTPSANTLTISAGAISAWGLSGNAGTTAGTHFIGTLDNQPLEFRANAQRALRLEPNSSGAPNFIGGSQRNFAGPGIVGATIGGGGAQDYSGYPSTNRVLADFGTIAGGGDNLIGTVSHSSTIGGGQMNTADANTSAGVISGGRQNTIGFGATHGVISGGWMNTIQGSWGTIGGGIGNTVGAYATVPGGSYNSADGTASFAAGYRAKATHTGTFVWGDLTETDIFSAIPNSVTMRASNGYRLFSDGGETSGVSLAGGGGSWTSLSDRHAKENFEQVDACEILERVISLPVSRWNYKSQHKNIRHIGPTAQDFKTAFGLGESETGITTIDADGVALAAIQGLNQKLEEQRAENAELKQSVNELRKLVHAMNQQLNGGAK
jgi:hypothetical protein